MRNDPGIIYGFVYSNDALVYLYSSGTVQVEPLDSSHHDLYASYPCIIPHEIFRIGEQYEVQERLDTYAVVPRAFTTFGHKLYFPESRLFFIGDHYSSEG